MFCIFLKVVKHSENHKNWYRWNCTDPQNKFNMSFILYHTVNVKMNPP